MAYKMNKRLFNQALEGKYGHIEGQHNRDIAAAEELGVKSHWTIKSWRNKRGPSPRNTALRGNIRNVLGSQLTEDERSKMFYMVAQPHKKKRGKKTAKVVKLRPGVKVTDKSINGVLREIKSNLQQIREALILSLADQRDFSKENVRIQLLERVSDFDDAVTEIEKGD